MLGRENSKYKVSKWQHAMSRKPECWIAGGIGEHGMTSDGTRGSGHAGF